MLIILLNNLILIKKRQIRKMNLSVMRVSSNVNLKSH